MENKLDLKLLGGLFFMAFSIFIALVSLVLIEDLPPYELTLTADGCAYAQSINLPIEKKSGQLLTLKKILIYFKVNLKMFV